jgi:hypothetical protein
MQRRRLKLKLASSFVGPGGIWSAPPAELPLNDDEGSTKDDDDARSSCFGPYHLSAHCCPSFKPPDAGH